MRVPETFGERLRRLRFRSGFATQGEVAAVLGVSNVSVCRWERQWCVPRPYLMSRLARLYGVTTYYLAHGREAPVRRAA